MPSPAQSGNGENCHGFCRIPVIDERHTGMVFFASGLAPNLFRRCVIMQVQMNSIAQTAGYFARLSALPH